MLISKLPNIKPGRRTHGDPVGAGPVTLTIGPRRCEPGVAERGDLQLTRYLLGVGDVRLVIVVLRIRFNGRERSRREGAGRTPWVEENGILNLLRGPTISSMSLVEFSRKVSGHGREYDLDIRAAADTHSLR